MKVVCGSKMRSKGFRVVVQERSLPTGCGGKEDKLKASSVPGIRALGDLQGVCGGFVAASSFLGAFGKGNPFKSIPCTRCRYGSSGYQSSSNSVVPKMFRNGGHRNQHHHGHHGKMFPHSSSIQLLTEACNVDGSVEVIPTGCDVQLGLPRIWRTGFRGACFGAFV